jgi:type I restriction enzyme S subunit
MAAEWRELTVEQSMAAVIDYRGKTPRKAAKGIPLITAKIVKGGRIEAPDEFVAEEDYDEWMRRGLPQRGDVVLTTEAPLGEVAQLNDARVALAQRLVCLRGRPELLDNDFLKFLMQSPSVQAQLHSRASGTTVLGIKQSELRKIVLLLPPLAEQRAIAHILGTLDDKIELNRRMSETLEAMARALFKSWFVDFDPVRAKAEGRDPGLPKPLADLFPSRLIDSALGEIPEGWDVTTLPEVIEVNPSRPLRKGQVAPYLDMANMPTRGHVPDEVIERPFGSGMRFINGDTLVARITPCLENGKTAFVDFLQHGQVGWGSTEYIVLRPRSPLPSEFAYCLARSDSFREFAIQSMTGTSGRQRVQADSLAHYRLPRVPRQVAEAFGRAVKPLVVRSSNAARESRALAALRDTLLPKLISGELRAKNTERFMERVGA